MLVGSVPALTLNAAKILKMACTELRVKFFKKVIPVNVEFLTNFRLTD